MSIDYNSPEFDRDYLTVLEYETVDALTGRILNLGQKVIRSPYNPAFVVLDTPTNRRKFVEMEYIWDEPTRKRIQKQKRDALVQQVKDKIDEWSLVINFGNIRSIDISREFGGMKISLVDSIFEELVQTGDYKYGNPAKDFETEDLYKVIIQI